jgi:putative N6-adenine-specific DNA methylase
LDFNTHQKIRVTHALYCGKPLIDELKALGYPVTGQDRLNVTLRGSLKDAITLNLHLRTAHRILFHLFSFKAKDLDVLYQKIREYNWRQVILEDGYFSINSYTNQKNVHDTRIVNLKAKDAIADHFMKHAGRRPDSGNKYDKLVLFIFWVDDTCSVYIDTSGESIAKHGYRLHGWKAPLSEALAACLIQSTRWDKISTFINPMCGSGTLAIEAALMATGRYPGLFRHNYSFRYIKGFQEEFYETQLNALKRKMTDQQTPRIIATDIQAEALRKARRNADKAGVSDRIHFSQCQFQDTPVDTGKGILIINPEYGERMGDTDKLKITYKEIGDFLKTRCQGKTGYIFTGNPELAKSVGLRTNRKIPFMNGKIECRLLEYELYKGTYIKNKSSISGNNAP